jgi:hypothetical protein
MEPGLERRLCSRWRSWYVWRRLRTEAAAEFAKTRLHFSILDSEIDEEWYTLNMGSRSFPTRATVGLHRKLGLHIVLDLELVRSRQQAWSSMRTLVTLVPAKKKMIRRANGRFDGCTACATAVKIAAMIPAGVSDL